MTRFITIRQVDGSEDHFSDRDLPLSIGSAPGNHIQLPGSDQQAAYIDDAQGHLFVQPAAHLAVPLLHNDRQLLESTWLKSKDRLSCEAFVISYERSGDRILFRVAEERGGEAPILSPPSHPPPGAVSQGNSTTTEELPVDIARSGGSSGKKKAAIAVFGLIFLVLGCAVLFVLLARPLELDVTPEPDSVAVSGFFPVVKIGGRYLLLPADYSVAIQKKGYKDFRTDVRVEQGGDESLQVKLEKLPGRLNLRITPPDDVEVYSGDQLLVTTPPHTIQIAPGSHSLTLTKARYRPYQTEIVIEGREIVQDMEVSLEPDWADITILSIPDGAEAVIDGAAAGSTPLTLPLLSGSHEIELNLASHTPSSRSITVQAGIGAVYAFELTLLPGQLALTSRPDGAAVSIGNDYQGTTPLSLSLPSGLAQEIRMSLPGYQSVSHSLTLAPGEERNLELELEQEQGVVFLTITPPDASVTINGRPYADVQGALTLPAQAQTFEVSAPGYQSVSRTVTPNPAYSQQLAIELLPESGTGKSPVDSSVDTDALTTSAGHRLLFIQPAPFMMGAPRREPGRRANERQRQVTLKRPFLIAEKLVTNGQYKKFEGSHSSGTFSGHSLDGQDQPVVDVTWNQAVAYLNWLSQQEELEPFYQKQGDGYVTVSPPTNGYRLPTEAEWAFIARQAGGQEIQRYPWSGGFPPRSVVANLGDESARTILPRVIQGYNDTFPVTSPVGHFPANRAGLYDIGGNASEWCHDYYSAYTGRLTEDTDPLGPPVGTHRVIRGSNWRDATLAETRLSYRAYHKEARNNVGFRIARYP